MVRPEKERAWPVEAGRTHPDSVGIALTPRKALRPRLRQVSFNSNLVSNAAGAGRGARLWSGSRLRLSPPTLPHQKARDEGQPKGRRGRGAGQDRDIDRIGPIDDVKGRVQGRWRERFEHVLDAPQTREGVSQ